MPELIYLLIGTRSKNGKCHVWTLKLRGKDWEIDQWWNRAKCQQYQLIRCKNWINSKLGQATDSWKARN